MSKRIKSKVNNAHEGVGADFSQPSPTGPVYTGLRRALAQDMAGQDRGPVRVRLLARDFEDQTTVERPFLTSLLVAEMRRSKGDL